MSNRPKHERHNVGEFMKDVSRQMAHSLVISKDFISDYTATMSNVAQLAHADGKAQVIPELAPSEDPETTAEYIQSVRDDFARSPILSEKFVGWLISNLESIEKMAHERGVQEGRKLVLREVHES